MKATKLTQRTPLSLMLSKLSSQTKNYWCQQQQFYRHLGLSIWDVES
ncbi:hypothetical protein ACFOD0_04780 [Shewanella intestini]|uniref:Uncharacterized protein n=1 Tax=Shewanella intestini TaxID=2017544 RepID=A0ABS5I0R5_9GAMM|nr:MULTISPECIES: hypothetical protein [Shewanella]MBR9727616.1 hypothetical protein [Shewanella intestini]MRG35234.1 hypothetical protein [Shewanella sp. XMDDZSB0408]